MKRGQTLFVIDQTEHKLNVMNAQANLAAAKAQMETTKMQYESRKKPLEAFKKTNKRKNRICQPNWMKSTYRY